MGVSRAVMREAFGALAALKLIDVGNGRRPRVAALDGSVMAASLDHAVSTAQVTRARDLGRPADDRAAHRRPRRRASIARTRPCEIVRLAEAMAADGDDLGRMTRHDIAFHEAIARASHNALFVQIVASFGPLMEVAVPAAWQTRVAERQRDTMIDRHRALAEAIARRDPEAAGAAMDAHFDASIADILKADAAAVPA